jgi:hypothetical protein
LILSVDESAEVAIGDVAKAIAKAMNFEGLFFSLYFRQSFSIVVLPTVRKSGV